MTTNRCRLCGNAELIDIIDLGPVPSIHILHRSAESVPLFPIHLFYCPQCGLGQFLALDQADELYESSHIYTTAHQGSSYRRDLIDTLNSMRPGRKIIELGCNEGTFLEALRADGFGPVVGVEPNRHARKLALGRGLNVIDGFFNAKMSAALLSQYGRFDVVVARHLLEHVDDVTGFLNGIHGLLSDNGIFLLELPYIEPGFAVGAPNVLWEEHINYFPLETLAAMLRNYGFEPHLWRYYTGGALVVAIFAQRVEVRKPSVWPERNATWQVFSNFAERVSSYQKNLNEVLELASESGRRIVLYGAGFRSSTTINAANVGHLIDEVIDDRSELEGYLMPGTNVAIKPLTKFVPDSKPLLLVLGVGAEHERKVLQRFMELNLAEVIPLSIVYPGDVAAFCRQALELMNLRRSGKGA